MISKLFKCFANNETLQEKVTDEHVKELEMAKRVQQALLSAEIPHLDGIRIAKRCDPANNIGGDFYNFVFKSGQKLQQKPKSLGVIEYINTNEEEIGIVIGDVAGHGVSSALVMALSSGLLDKIGQNNSSPSTILEKANEDIRKFISNSQISHLTAFYGSLNITTKQFTYAKAGHHPVMLIRENNDIIHLDSKGVFLGMYNNEKYEEKSFQLQDKDRLFFYTDGIIEASNIQHKEYGIERLEKLCKSNQKTPIDTLMTKIFDDVKSHTGNKESNDDQTLIILEIDTCGPNQ